MNWDRGMKITWMIWGYAHDPWKPAYDTGGTFSSRIYQTGHEEMSDFCSKISANKHIDINSSLEANDIIIIIIII
jgi:hypothetical protein